MGLNGRFDQIFAKIGRPVTRSHFDESVRIYPGDDPDYPISGSVELSNGQYETGTNQEEEQLRCRLTCDYDATTGIVDPRRGWWITIPAEGNTVKYRFDRVESIGGGSIVSIWINERISDMYGSQHL